ncbi:low-density lipoprotein receptor class A repeat-containing protein [Euryarchaeota archaeon]|nr:low-density lipoprotein receptor class A repeat-containing protein [Euryarchaeota archaeon]
MRQTTVTLFVTILLLTSFSPVVSASGPSDSVIWGVSYDWSELDNDQETLTGISPTEIFQDLEQAAIIAKFDLDALSIISGNTYLFFEQWEDEGTISFEDANGDLYDATVRNTEITLRHGSRNDQGISTSWIDENSSIDIDYRASQTGLVVLDVLYTEYLNFDSEHLGADLTITGTAEQATDVELSVDLIGGGESYDAEVGLGVITGITIDSIISEWRTFEPLPLLTNMSYDSIDYRYDWGDFGMVSGDYSVSANYDLSLEGIPTEELDISADALDISISDTVTSAGAFYEDFGTMIWTGESSPPCNGLNPAMEADIGGENSVQVQCRQVFPIFSPGLLGMAAVSMNSAFTDSSAFEAASEELIQELSSTVEDAMDDIQDDENSTASDVFICDDGTEIPAYWVNDGEEDCPDGSDEYESELSGPEAMVDAWANSDLSSTMEMFTDSLSELLSDNTESPTFEIENACFTTLWDSSEMMVVGFAWMQDGYMILGPDIDGIGVHSTELGIDYLVGDNARNAQASASNLESLVSLAPPSQHDARTIDELVGIDQEESSDFAVPGLGIYATLTILCLSAILAKRD